MTEPPNKRVYLDSNVLIYAVEGIPSVDGPTKKLIKFLSDHLMSAIRSDCRFFVTGDADLKKLPSGMKHVPPDESAIESLLKVLS